ncbi:MAG: carboxypeptidase-like regulatory domain-containing protein, partial [Pyrinomonadaceae bacterium]
MTPRPSTTIPRRGARSRKVKRLLFIIMLTLGQMLAQSVSAQQQQQQRSGNGARAGTPPAAGSITGRVLAEGGQAPLGVTVFASGAGASLPSRQTGTDADGKFHLDNLAPGAYRLTVEAPGYVVVPDATRDRRRKNYYRPGDSVSISLMKGGVITGAVTYADGQPVVAIPVSATRVRDREGRSTRDSTQGSAQRWTDDQGVYRIYGLQPGVYIVAASGGGPSYGGPLFEDDAPTYYPSATRDTATEITVSGGQEIHSIDIRYRSEQGHTISGTLSGEFLHTAGSGSLSVWLTHVPSGAVEATTYISTWERADSSFAIRGVPDGDYYIFARSGYDERVASSFPRRVSVKGADVTGLQLTLVPTGTITGRVVLETTRDTERRAECRNRLAASLEEVIVNARRDDAGTDKERLPRQFAGTRERTPDDQGNFEIVNLAAGRYRLLASLPVDDWYVRSVTLPAVAPARQPIDAARDGLALKPGERAQSVTITLAGGATGLRGRVAAAMVEGSPVSL